MGAEGSTFDRYQPLYSRVFAQSLIIEFVGLLLFQFLGGTVTNDILGPFVNGLALAVLVYMAANISGGHLNPAVSISACACGFYPPLHTVVYIIVQIVGAIFGALLAAGLVPGSSVGSGAGPGCFVREVSVNPALSNAQIYGWEVVMTFVLISVVYACGLTQPGHGSFTPLAVGLSLLACAGTGAAQTGAALNPARVLGPAIVFNCGWNIAWLYILAHITAAVLACCLFITVSGPGPLFPFKLKEQYGLTHAEAVRMWLTGGLPKRIRNTAGLPFKIPGFLKGKGSNKGMKDDFNTTGTGTGPGTGTDVTGRPMETKAAV